jgi:hypothetical protein
VSTGISIKQKALISSITLFRVIARDDAGFTDKACEWWKAKEP